MIIKPVVVDIYHGDAVTSFSQAKAAGLVGVIHKATQGAGMVDNKYAERRKAAVAAGLLWGAYHFANDQDVDAQIANFLNAAHPDDNTLVALDFEPNGNHTMSLRQARAFLQKIEATLKRKAVLYSGNLAKEQLGGNVDAYFGLHRLWLCQYGPMPKVQKSWKKPWLWQYTGDNIGPQPHKIPGVPGAGGAVDLNTYDGPIDQLAKDWAS